MGCGSSCAHKIFGFQSEGGMNTRANKKNSETTIDDVLGLIGDIKAGNFSKQLDKSLDPKLNALVEGLNDLTKTLAAQSTPAAKEAQAALDVSCIVKSLGIGIWKWDLATNSLEWDENMYQLYGANKEDFSGAYDAWENSLSSETKAKAVEEINAALAGGKPFNTTFKVVQRNSGKVQEVRTRAFIISDTEGKALKMWGINIDRTREAELELELKIEQLKVIKNAKLVRTASDQKLDWTSVIKDLKAIETAADRIAKIVKSLRTYSRNAEHDPFEETRISDIINDTFELCKERFSIANIELHAQIDPSISIRCRPAEISQVLMNLLNNSYDAVASLKSKWIRIDAHQKDGRVQLQFTDSGTGIPEAISEEMMNPFFTTKEVGKGTGLGLSISTGIITTHGGVLAYDKSAPNTTFTIDLPDAKHFVKSKAHPARTNLQKFSV